LFLSLPTLILFFLKKINRPVSEACWYFFQAFFFFDLMETDTTPKAPNILGTAKLLASSLSTKYESRESVNIARILVEEVTGKPYKWLLMNPMAAFDDQEFQRWNEFATRLLQGEPVQYLIGKAAFCGLSLLVNPDVLIPRPETEELVAWVLERLQGKLTPAVLDLGTGSGCIALAVAHSLPEALVVGVDLSDAAVSIATENARLNGITSKFRSLDMLAAGISEFEGVDLIVSNPPYIPESEWRSLDENVRAYEPSLALKVPDSDPLRFYHKVSERSRHWLKEEGWLFFEIHEQFGSEVEALLTGLGYASIETRKDMRGRDRMVCAQWLGKVTAHPVA
jgi:release factor glutamine methyltransferase